MLLSNQQIALRPRSEPKHVPFAISLKTAVGDADHFREGACGSVNRPAESLTKPATYPERGIWFFSSKVEQAAHNCRALVRFQEEPPKIDFY